MSMDGPPRQLAAHQVDDWESDEMDSDIEVRLYSSIHHSYEEAVAGSTPSGPEVTKRTFRLGHDSSPVFGSNVSPIESKGRRGTVQERPKSYREALFNKSPLQANNRPLQASLLQLPSKSRTREVVTIISDSDTDSESKARVIYKMSLKKETQQMKGSTETSATSESDIEDPFGGQNTIDISSSAWSHSSESDAGLAISKAFLGQSSSSMKIGNVVGANSGLSRVSLNALTKRAFEHSSDEDELNHSLSRTEKPVTESKTIYDNFLSRCQPEYDPTTSTKPRLPRKRKRENPKAGLEAAAGSSKSNSRQNLDKDVGNGDEDHEALWKVDIEDLVAQSSFAPKQRYYRRYKCFHCSIWTDHDSNNCPRPNKKEPVCPLCAQNGHAERQCPSQMCWKCFEPGHGGSDCGLNFKLNNCDECGLVGHLAQVCPNHWRKFHATVSMGIGSSSKSAKGINRNKNCSCSSCGARGHFAFECRHVEQIRAGWPSCPFLQPTKFMFNRAGLLVDKGTVTYGQRQEQANVESDLELDTFFESPEPGKRKYSMTLRSSNKKARFMSEFERTAVSKAEVGGTNRWINCHFPKNGHGSKANSSVQSGSKKNKKQRKGKKQNLIASNFLASDAQYFSNRPPKPEAASTNNTNSSMSKKERKAKAKAKAKKKKNKTKANKINVKKEIKKEGT